MSEFDDIANLSDLDSVDIPGELSDNESFELIFEDELVWKDQTAIMTCSATTFKWNFETCVYTQSYNGEKLYEASFSGTKEEFDANISIEKIKDFISHIEEYRLRVTPDLRLCDCFDEYDTLHTLDFNKSVYLIYEEEDSLYGNPLVYFGKETGSMKKVENKDVILFLNYEVYNESSVKECLIKLPNFKELVETSSIQDLKGKLTINVEPKMESEKLTILKTKLFDKTKIKFSSFNELFLTSFGLNEGLYSVDVEVSHMLPLAIDEEGIYYCKFDFGLCQLKKDFIDKIKLMNKDIDYYNEVLPVCGNVNVLLKTTGSYKFKNDKPNFVSVQNSADYLLRLIKDGSNILIIGDNEYNRFNHLGFTNQLIQTINTNYIDVLDYDSYCTLITLTHCFITEQAMKKNKSLKNCPMNQLYIYESRQNKPARTYICEIKYECCEISLLCTSVEELEVEGLKVNYKELDYDVWYLGKYKEDLVSFVIKHYEKNKIEITIGSIKNGRVATDYSVLCNQLKKSHYKINKKLRDVKLSELLSKIDFKNVIKDEELFKDDSDHSLNVGYNAYNTIDVELHSFSTFKQNGSILLTRDVDFMANESIYPGKVLIIENKYYIDKQIYNLNTLLKITEEFEHRTINYSKTFFLLCILKKVSFNKFNQLIRKDHLTKEIVEDEVVEKYNLNKYIIDFNNFRSFNDEHKNLYMNRMYLNKKYIYLSGNYWITINKLNFCVQFSLLDARKVLYILGCTSDEFEVDDGFFDMTLDQQEQVLINKLLEDELND